MPPDTPGHKTKDYMTSCFVLDNTIQYKNFVLFLYKITLKLRFNKYIYVLWSSTMKLSVFLGIITTLIAESTGKEKLTQCRLLVFQLCEKGAAKNSLNSENQHIIFQRCFDLYIRCMYYMYTTQTLLRK